MKLSHILSVPFFQQCMSGFCIRAYVPTFSRAFYCLIAVRKFFFHNQSYSGNYCSFDLVTGKGLYFSRDKIKVKLRISMVLVVLAHISFPLVLEPMVGQNYHPMTQAQQDISFTTVYIPHVTSGTYFFNQPQWEGRNAGQDSHLLPWTGIEPGPLDSWQGMLTVTPQS